VNILCGQCWCFMWHCDGCGFVLFICVYLGFRSSGTVMCVYLICNWVVFL
jgi:hypothetical protein